MSKQTVIDYVGHIIDSYLLFSVQNYAAKLLEKEPTPKYYVMDTGFLGPFLPNCDTVQLENLVAIELIRRYGKENIYYFEMNIKIDFYVPSDQLAIQVSWNMWENDDTRSREVGAFVKLHLSFPDARCLVLTNSEQAELQVDGMQVSVVPAWEWLLQERSEQDANVSVTSGFRRPERRGLCLLSGLREHDRPIDFRSGTGPVCKDPGQLSEIGPYVGPVYPWELPRGPGRQYRGLAGGKGRRLSITSSVAGGEGAGRPS